MSHPDPGSFAQRVQLSLRLLIQPTRGNFLAIARVSQGEWARSLVLCACATTVITATASKSLGVSTTPGYLVSTPILISLLALSWAAAAQAVSMRVLGRNRNVFDPLLYILATSCQFLLMGSFFLGLLPGSPILITGIPLIYSQLLLVLAVRAIGNTTLARATTVMIAAAVLGFVVALMSSWIIRGLPGFFERGYLR